MKTRLLFILIGIILFFTACSQNIQALRYDGIYKERSNKEIVYRKFIKEKGKYYSVVLDNDNDKKAIIELDKKEKDGLDYTRYTNDVKKVRIYGGNNNYSWHGEIEKNKRGELKDNYFIKTQNGIIKEVIDLRVVDKFMLYSHNGDILSNEIYNMINIIDDDYAIVKKNDKFGILDIKQNKLKAPIIYDWIETRSISNKILPFKINEKYGFFDSKFNVMIKAKYDGVKYFGSTGYFTDNIAPVKIKDKWIIIDNKDNLVINTAFDSIGKFLSKEFIPIYDNKTKLYNFANLNTAQFTGVKAYKNYPVYDYNILNVGGGKHAIFDKTGNLVLKEIYDNIFPYINKNGNTLFSVKKGKYEGIIDKNNKTILPIKFDNIKIIRSLDGDIKFFRVQEDRYFYTLYNLNGKKVIPTTEGDIELMFFKDKYLIHVKVEEPKKTLHYLYNGISHKPIFNADYIWRRGEYISYNKNGLEGLMDFNLNKIIEKKVKDINAKGDLISVYDDGESEIFNIKNIKDEILTLDGKVDFESNYIILNEYRKKYVYDYNLNKLNDNYLLTYNFCYPKEETITFRDKNDKLGMIHKNKLIYMDKKIEQLECSNNYIIAKLKEKIKKD